ncbi:hypothetical protein FWKOB_01985 [Arcobacter sp. FWKO B]|nr:hypothetical protein FWKOB_01985 [Arcobacter sp. FWKO B]
MDDIKKDITLEEKNEDKILLEVTYNPIGRIFAFLFYLMIFTFGLALIIYDHYISIAIGIISILIGTYFGLGILNFKKLVFYNDRVSYYRNIFINNNNPKEISYNELNYVSLTNGRYVGGSLSFNMLKPFGEKTISFQIDLLPISNKTLMKIKKILVEKKVIEKDAHVWDYD